MYYIKVSSPKHHYFTMEARDNAFVPRRYTLTQSGWGINGDWNTFLNVLEKNNVYIFRKAQVSSLKVSHAAEEKLLWRDWKVKKREAKSSSSLHLRKSSAAVGKPSFGVLWRGHRGTKGSVWDSLQPRCALSLDQLVNSNLSTFVLFGREDNNLLKVKTTSTGRRLVF